jgi:hypothetical protein
VDETRVKVALYVKLRAHRGDWSSTQAAEAAAQAPDYGNGSAAEYCLRSCAYA